MQPSSIYNHLHNEPLHIPTPCLQHEGPNFIPDIKASKRWVVEAQELPEPQPVAFRWQGPGERAQGQAGGSAGSDQTAEASGAAGRGAGSGHAGAAASAGMAVGRWVRLEEIPSGVLKALGHVGGSTS